MASNINCPNCQRPVPPGAHSCPHCGTQLQAQVQQRRLASEELTAALPDVVKQFDASATTNITIAGVLIGFYSGAIFAGRVISGAVFNALVYALPLCLLLTTIVFALRVFYPDGYLTDDSLTLIKKKERRLRFSSIFLEVAIGILIIAVFVYLLRPS
jgi:Double zinc ribbon